MPMQDWYPDIQPDGRVVIRDRITGEVFQTDQMGNALTPQGAQQPPWGGIKRSMAQGRPGGNVPVGEGGYAPPTAGPSMPGGGVGPPSTTTPSRPGIPPGAAAGPMPGAGGVGRPTPTPVPGYLPGGGAGGAMPTLGGAFAGPPAGVTMPPFTWPNINLPPLDIQPGMDAAQWAAQYALQLAELKRMLEDLRQVAIPSTRANIDAALYNIANLGYQSQVSARESQAAMTGLIPQWLPQPPAFRPGGWRAYAPTTEQAAAPAGTPT